MLTRMMGEENDALSCTYTHPFTDVPEWGDRYVAWAYYKEYTKGTSATTFSPDEPITAQQYLAFVLRAMGYGDDTTYQTTIEDAIRFGIIPPDAYGDVSVPFLRADMVHIVYLALQANEKTTGAPFYTYLIDKGTLDSETAFSIFNPEPADDTGNEDADKTLDELYDPNGRLSYYRHTTIRLPDILDIISFHQQTYSLTNTNNDKSSCTLSINGNMRCFVKKFYPSVVSVYYTQSIS